MDTKNEIMHLLERMDKTMLIAVKNVLLALVREEEKNGRIEGNHH